MKPKWFAIALLACAAILVALSAMSFVHSQKIQQRVAYIDDMGNEIDLPDSLAHLGYQGGDRALPKNVRHRRIYMGIGSALVVLSMGCIVGAVVLFKKVRGKRSMI